MTDVFPDQKTVTVYERKVKSAPHDRDLFTFLVRVSSFFSYCCVIHSSVLSFPHYLGIFLHSHLLIYILHFAVPDILSVHFHNLNSYYNFSISLAPPRISIHIIPRLLLFICVFKHPYCFILYLVYFQPVVLILLSSLNKNNILLNLLLWYASSHYYVHKGPRFNPQLYRNF